MEAQALQEPSGQSSAPVSLGELEARFVSLLALPDDPEVRDIAVMLHEALRTALLTDQAALLEDALTFARGRLAVRGLTDAGREEIGAALALAAAPQLSDGEQVSVESLVARCWTAHPLAPSSPDPAVLRPLAAAYVERLLAGDRRGALALVRRSVVEGVEIHEILLDVLEPAQREVGRLWALGIISVAQEHFCTAVTQFVMTDLYPALFRGEESQRHLVAVHAPGSTHHVGLRMVADVLECRDWSTNYCADEVTVESLPDLVAEDRADLLLISASMPSQIPDVEAMIRAIREDPRTQRVKVVVGGRPFRVAPGAVGAVGADGWAFDARSAVEVCESLVVGDSDE